MSSREPSVTEETSVRASREITAARADVKRMESRFGKAGEDASKALAEISELSKKDSTLNTARVCEAVCFLCSYKTAVKISVQILKANS